MTRTNVEIDDALVSAAMVRLGVRTKRQAIHLALQRVAGEPLTQQDLDRVRGIGWDGDLDAMRDDGAALDS